MDTIEELNGTYFYGGFVNLTPAELFKAILLEKFARYTEIELSAASLILSGMPLIPTRTKPGGAVWGTSLASIISRSALNKIHFPEGVQVYTLIGVNPSKIHFAKTNKLGTVIGRYIPYIGWAGAAATAWRIAYETRRHYNLIARPEHRIQWAAF